MEKSNHSSSPEIKFSISERLKKAELAIDQEAKKDLGQQNVPHNQDIDPEATYGMEMKAAKEIEKVLLEAEAESPKINKPTVEKQIPKASLTNHLNTVSKPKTSINLDGKTNIENSDILFKNNKSEISTKDILDSNGEIPGPLNSKKKESSGSNPKPALAAPSRYKLKDTVGQGGMGIIRSVKDASLSRTLAMKILSPKHAQDEGVIDAFIEEANITARLQHPNIIPVHDLGVLPENGNHFYTMKLVDGHSLQEVIEKLQNNEPEAVKKYNLFNLMSIFKKVCDAVAYAHSKGIIHRDIKPGNIMVGQFGEVLLLDWGLAKHSHSEEQVNLEEKLAEIELTDSLMTMDGIIKGSLAYLSPEQANGDIKEVDHQTDIFLLGATLYHMLTLCPPYNSKNMVEIIRMAESTSFVHPNETEFGSRIPEALVNIILKSMEGDKAKRFQTITEMSNKIDDYLQGRNVSKLRKYRTGDLLIQDQELEDDTFIIVSGSVEISRNIDGTETVIEALEKGAVFGELAALTHDLRTATVRALEDTDVMIISKQLMFDEIRKLPPWLEKVLFNLATKVSSMNERIHPFILSNCSLPVLKQLLYIFSMVNTNADNGKTVSISYHGVVHEISQNLGLSNSRIEEIIDILEEFNLAEKSSDGRFCIVNLNNIKNIVAYIKREQNITEGIGYTLEEIDIEKIPFFDDVYQRMATLHY